MCNQILLLRTFLQYLKEWYYYNTYQNVTKRMKPHNLSKWKFCVLIIVFVSICVYFRHSEHLIPKYMNRKWREQQQFFKEGDQEVEEFLLKFREKLYMEKKTQSYVSKKYASIFMNILYLFWIFYIYSI